MRLGHWALLAIAGGACGLASASETTTYSYDALGRLITTAKTGGPRNGKSNNVAYDPAGNRSGTGVGQTAPPVIDAAQFSVAGPSSLTEGSPAVFTITKTGSAANPLSISYATVSGSAVSPADFTSGSGVLTFRAWETVQTVSVPTISDTSTEGSEQFTLQLSAPSAGASIGTATGTATIAANTYNQPPVPGADALVAPICDSGTVNVVANDTDPEGHLPLTVVSVTSSNLGTASVQGTTSVTFNSFGTPGGATLNYTVRDSLGATSIGVINLSVPNGPGCN